MASTAKGPAASTAQFRTALVVSMSLSRGMPLKTPVRNVEASFEKLSVTRWPSAGAKEALASPERSVSAAATSVPSPAS